MKQLTLSVIGFAMLAEGECVIITRPTAENPKGTFKFKAAGAARLSQRALGFNNPVVLQHAVKLAVAKGQCKLTVDATLCKIGDTWENKVTGQTGVYGDKMTGEKKDYWRFENHELDLGTSVAEKMFDLSMSANMSQLAVPAFVPAQPVAQPAANFGVTNATPVAAGNEHEEEPEV